MPTITKRFCTKNSRYKANQKLNPAGVVLHSIGCPQPDANVLQRSWQNNVSPYVTHYVLDDEKILQCMPHDRKCWHAGSPGNAKWLGVEMCEPSSIKYIPNAGAKFTIKDRAASRAYCEKAYKNAVWLLAELCREYGWNPQTAILTHYEVTKRKLSKTDHVDPEHLWNGLGLSYSLETLRKDVASAMVKQTTHATTNAAAGTNNGGYLVRVTASVLNVRAGAGTGYKVNTTVKKGGVYTIVAEQNGWGKLKSGAGWVNLKYAEKI